jgi:hypothetical protein
MDECKGKYPQSLEELSGRMDTQANRWIEEYVPGSVVTGILHQLGNYSYMPFHLAVRTVASALLSMEVISPDVLLQVRL